MHLSLLLKIARPLVSTAKSLWHISTNLNVSIILAYTFHQCHQLFSSRATSRCLTVLIALDLIICLFSKTVSFMSLVGTN